MWISEREGNSSTGCGTYPHIPDEAQMNNHQDSCLVSIRLIFVFILASSVPLEKKKLKSNTDIKLKRCNTSTIHVRVNPSNIFDTNNLKTLLCVKT